MHVAAPAAWLRVKVCPAIVAVPLRACPGFEATVSVTVPLLVPLLPTLIVSHAALLVAVHEQVEGAVTRTVTVVPPAGAVALAGLIDWLQVAAPDDCVIVSVWPAIVSVPTRAAPGFAANE